MTVVIARVVWYIVGFIAVVLALRMVLLLLGAQQAMHFVDFVYSFSAVFASPFSGYLASRLVTMGSPLRLTLVALLVYLLVGWGVAKLLTIGSASPRA